MPLKRIKQLPLLPTIADPELVQPFSRGFSANHEPGVLQYLYPAGNTINGLLFSL